MKLFEAYSDGASSGNPGPAGIGVVISSEGAVVKTVSESIGEATNNVAEYAAIIRALKELKGLGAEHIRLRMDSELVYFQLKGDYKVKHPNLKPFYEEALALLRCFKKVECKVVPREENKEADRLATSALKNSKAGHDGRSFEFVIGEESPSSKG